MQNLTWTTIDTYDPGTIPPDGYVFVSDPGHGWLRVPSAELAALGFTPSAFSYVAGPFTYLEEDSDLGGYMRARGFDLETGRVWFGENVAEFHVNDSCALPFARR